MSDIRILVEQYIRETGQARLTELDGTPAVEFLDEGEVIPLADLAYSSELGFYRKSLFGEQHDHHNYPHR